MMQKRALIQTGAAMYEVVVGVVLLIVGIRGHSWWTGTLGAGLIVLGAATGFGRGEGASWLRGDLDERRRQAVDHAFRTAFFVLAWWVAGLAVYGGNHAVTPTLLGAGNAVGIAVAYIDYALVVRKS